MKKRSMSLAGLAGAALMLGCQGGPNAATRPASTGAAGAEGRAVAEAQASGQVLPPPFIEPTILLARKGEALKKARLKLDQVIASLPTPAFLAATTRPSTQPAATRPNESPLPAERAYFLGRVAWRERRGAEAINYLQTAERLAPGNTPIMRLLGEIYGAMGNKIRSAYYFEQAVAADPDDVESLFVLGRFAIEQTKWDNATVLFARAISRPRGAGAAGVDPGIWSFLRYSLAGALERGGYDAAAIEQYRLCLDTPASTGQTTRLAREMLFLSRQKSYLWLAIGDAHHRLDDPAAAAVAYQNAASLQTEDPLLLAGRVAYTDLLLRKREPAQDVAVSALKAAKANPQAIDLVRYVNSNSPRKSTLVPRVTQVYEELDRPGPLAVAISQIIGGEAGQAFLEKHLAAKPGDAGVGEQLIRQALAGNGSASASASRSAESFAPALRIAGAAITASPAQAKRYAAVFLEESAEPSVLLAAFDVLTPAEKAKAASLYLRGKILEKDGRAEEASAAYAAAVAADPALQAARVELVRQLAEQRQYDKAEEMLKPLADSRDSDLMALRVGILAQTNRAPEALKLLDERLAQPPLNIAFVIQKAMLQRAMNDAPGSERTLLDALDAQPQAEPLYDALFDLYESPQAAADASQQYQRLMRRLQRTIPQSRIARLMLSEWMVANNQVEQAEKNLRGLILENPRDYKAISTLLELLTTNNRQPEASAVIDQGLAKAPRDGRMLQVAIEHYRRVGDKKKFNQIVERRLLLEPPGPERAQRLAVVYMEDKRPAEAVKALNEALADKAGVKDPRPLVHRLADALIANNQPDEADKVVHEAIVKFPGHELDLTYEWAAHLDRRGKRDEAHKVMLELLAKHPDHAMTNNALGYAWADQGKNLKKAKELLTRAVQTEPGNSAYLDSMGWVCYKLGEFPEAIKWLKRAQGANNGEYPVILDHLGEALFRAGDRPQAMQTWRRALELARELGPAAEAEDPELKGLADRLTRKIQAAEQGQQPALSPVPGPEAEPETKPQTKPAAMGDFEEGIVLITRPSELTNIPVP
ncbi:MAG: tetratricopeptide repeat protein [Planctomycetota bacterium]|nr:tetratricopeptide repeat protein [Planctomycetota bacterium]